MAEKKPDKCAHLGCNCPAAAGSKFTRRLHGAQRSLLSPQLRLLLSFPAPRVNGLIHGVGLSGQ
jgi:hypothetical protein